jgi:hypothetical protein
MLLTTECPSCREPIRVSEEVVGRSARCPKCGGTFVVTDPGPTHITAPDGAPERAVAPPPAAGPLDRPLPKLRRAGAGWLFTWGALLLAAAGFLLGATALGLVLFRDPLGSGMKRYDFSTPKAALNSQLQIQQNKDIRALMELSDLTDGPRLKEKMETLQVTREADWKNIKVLFVSYNEKGKTKHDVEGFEKNADCGLWVRKYVSSYEVAKGDKQLAKDMEEWEKSGEGDKDSSPFLP